MSILGSIFSKILGHHDAPAAAPAPAPAPGSDTVASTAPSPGAAASTPASTPAASTSAAAGGAAQPVDVAALLDGLAAKSSQKLDWKHSIVDMMKLLDMDSSLSARQELAKELNYSGDMHDSATMNIWLHKQVMSKLAENGGKVPDDLRH